MKVLFWTYPAAFNTPGGGEKVLECLKDELTRLEVDVQLFNPPLDRFLSKQLQPSSEVTIVHLFSCVQTYYWPELKRLFPKAVFVVTPTVYFPPSKARQLRTKLSIALDPVKHKAGIAPRWEFLRIPSLWLPSTHAEAKGLQQTWGISSAKIRVLPNGVQGPPDLKYHPRYQNCFLSKYKDLGLFVLHVARFDPVKNHKMLIRAIGLAKATCVFIGGIVPGYEDYFKECQALAQTVQKNDPTGKTRFIFLGHLQSTDPLLNDAYSAACVFVLPSHFETFGISALEAYVRGTSVLASTQMCTADAFAPFMTLIGPDDLNAWAREISVRINQSPPIRPTDLQRKKVLATYDWSNLGRQLLNRYLALIEKTSCPTESSVAQQNNKT